MAASDNLHPQQLAMFMPARKIVEDHFLGDGASYAVQSKQPHSKLETMDWKQHENLNDDQDNWGTERTNAPPTEPIEIRHLGTIRRDGSVYRNAKEVLDGHHRLAGALNRNPNEEVPMFHTDAQNSRSMRDFHNMARDRAQRKESVARRKSAEGA